jgi:hypothetical protein
MRQCIAVARPVGAEWWPALPVFWLDTGRHPSTGCRRVFCFFKHDMDCANRTTGVEYRLPCLEARDTAPAGLHFPGGAPRPSLPQPCAHDHHQNSANISRGNRASLPSLHVRQGVTINVPVPTHQKYRALPYHLIQYLISPVAISFMPASAEQCCVDAEDRHQRRIGAYRRHRRTSLFSLPR